MVNSAVPVLFVDFKFLAVSISNDKLVEVVIFACLFKIFNVLEAIFVVWLAVKVCKSIIFSSSVSKVPCKTFILVSFKDIWVEWLEVSICKAVVFGSSMFNLPCKALISLSFEAISIVWFDVCSSNSVKVVCNPSIIS